jgi:hypothetical protein
MIRITSGRFCISLDHPQIPFLMTSQIVLYPTKQDRGHSRRQTTVSGFLTHVGEGEDRLPLIAAVHDVLNGLFILYPEFSCHHRQRGTAPGEKQQHGYQ